VYASETGLTACSQHNQNDAQCYTLRRICAIDGSRNIRPMKLTRSYSSAAL